MRAAATSDRLRAAVLLLVACISTVVLTLLGIRARAGGVFAWDARVQAWLTSYAEPEKFNRTADDVIGLLLEFGADLITVMIVLVAVPVLLLAKRFREAGFLLASMGAGVVLTYLLKDIFE